MRDFVYGDDVVVLAYKVNGYVPFACVEEMTLKMTSEMLPSSSADSGAWEDFVFSGRNSWTASLNGVQVLQDDVDSLWFAWETLLEQVRTSGLNLKFTWKDRAGNEKYATGFARIPETELNGRSGDFGRYSIQLIGSGPLDLNGIIIPPINPNVKRIQWITNGGEPNKLQDNRLIGISKDQILLVSLEGDDKFFVIDAGEPGDKQVRLNSGEGSLRWAYEFDANQQAYCVIIEN